MTWQHEIVQMKFSLMDTRLVTVYEHEFEMDSESMSWTQIFYSYKSARDFSKFSSEAALKA